MKLTAKEYKGWQIVTLIDDQQIIYRVKDLRLPEAEAAQIEPIGSQQGYQLEWQAVAEAQQFIDRYLLRDEIMSLIDELVGDRVNGYTYFEIRELLTRLVGLGNKLG